MKSKLIPMFPHHLLSDDHVMVDAERTSKFQCNIIIFFFDFVFCVLKDKTSKNTLSFFFRLKKDKQETHGRS